MISPDSCWLGPESHFPADVRFQGLILASTFPPEVCIFTEIQLETFSETLEFSKRILGGIPGGLLSGCWTPAGG